MIATNTPSGAGPLRQAELQPASDFGPGRRPPLEILPDGYLSPRSRRRRARLAAAAGILLACGMLFGLAGVHVLLTQGEFRLARYQSKADAEQARFIRLRQSVAELESPSRIVADAEKLGMVTPTGIDYLPAVAPFTSPSNVPSSGGGAAPPPGNAGGASPGASPGNAVPRQSPPSLRDWAVAKTALPARP